MSKMLPLNLPPCSLQLEQRAEGIYVFDPLRKYAVRLTPEEWVRQHFVHYLISHLGYPRELMMNEVSLRLGKKPMRADTVLYDRRLSGRMLLEYKAPDVRLSDKTLQQALRYNYLLQVPYLVLSNGLVHIAYEINHARQSHRVLDKIPSYNDLIY